MDFMKNVSKPTKKFLITAAFMLSGITAFAYSAEADTKADTETVIEDNRTLTPKGNADLLDNVSDSEDLQFITVTARDGNVFYVVIDHAAENENVYFLNVVDESDLEALAEESDTEQEETLTDIEPVTPEPEPTEQEPEEPEQPDKDTGSNAGFIVVILLLAAAAGGGFYYYKVILPKKKLEQADDIEDFEFEEYEDEDTELDEEETDDEEFSKDIENE